MPNVGARNLNGNTTEPGSVRELIEHSRQHPMRWFVPDVVLEDGVHVLHGPEESFKTMLTLQLHEALTIGGPFLTRSSVRGLKTGIAELEMKNRLFGHRLSRFFRDTVPDIRVLPDSLRQKVLSGRTPKERMEVIANWAHEEALDFLSIDSAVKLFPPGCDLSRADLASEVFSQIQRLPTAWIIAHDRKPLPGIITKGGNAEIVGSGRFAQDPDVIHQMHRPDGRAPVAVFSWGKVREGAKCNPIPLYFDHADYRLYPLHPYLHLLGSRPVRQSEIIVQAERRYGWKERWAREQFPLLSQVVDSAGNPCVEERPDGHNRTYVLIGTPTGLLYSPEDLVQGCSNSSGISATESRASFEEVIATPEAIS
jgi:AAA domain